MYFDPYLDGVFAVAALLGLLVDFFVGDSDDFKGFLYGFGLLLRSP